MVAGQRSADTQTSVEPHRATRSHAMASLAGFRPAFRIWNHPAIPNFPFDLHPLSLSVFDPDRAFPADPYPRFPTESHTAFRARSGADLLREYLAHLLINGPTAFPTRATEGEWLGCISGSELPWLLQSQWNGLVGCRNHQGFGLIEPEVLRQAGIDRLVTCPQMHPSLTRGYSRSTFSPLARVRRRGFTSRSCGSRAQGGCAGDGLGEHGAR